MNLYQKVITIYPELEGTDLLAAGIELVDDGTGAVISSWTHATLTEPTVQELADLDGYATPIRKDKIQAIKDEALIRINAELPQIDSFEDLEMLRKLAAAFTLSAAGTTAKNIYQYAKGKIGDMKTDTLSNVDAYDPTTDVGWPT